MTAIHPGPRSSDAAPAGSIRIPAPRIYFATTGHRRHSNAPGAVSRTFSYSTCYWLVDLDDLPDLPGPLRRVVSFQARDHFGDPDASIGENARAVLAENGLAADRILMLTCPRTVGHVFNPLSVFYCFAAPADEGSGSGTAVNDVGRADEDDRRGAGRGGAGTGERAGHHQAAGQREAGTGERAGHHQAAGQREAGTGERAGQRKAGTTGTSVGDAASHLRSVDQRGADLGERAGQPKAGQRADVGELIAVIAEVHNTYGGRHVYVLRPDDSGRDTVGKQFYVSPFLPMGGTYLMRTPVPDERLAVSIALRQDGGTPFVATLTGRGRPITTSSVVASLARWPLLTLRTSALIRWQGIRLWLRRVPVQPRPADAIRNERGR